MRVAELVKPYRGWKKQTVFTLLNRLVEKGFLSSTKTGKERYYEPLVEREDYLRQETGRFVECALVSSTDIDDKELAELSAWLEKDMLKEKTGNEWFFTLFEFKYHQYNVRRVRNFFDHVRGYLHFGYGREAALRQNQSS
jgi:predicted transcriptional regulator